MPPITDAQLQHVLNNRKQILLDLDRVDSERSLHKFIKLHWHILEPQQPFIDGWPLGAICEHLQAVTSGEIKRLLINVPPGFMKSLATDVFWPAWEWGPKNMPSMRYLSFSYSAQLTERDNNRFRDLIRSPEYQANWGSKFQISPHTFNTTKAQNSKTGWKIATSVGGVGTGERGDRVVVDDPHNVKESESDTVREETVRWFRESLQTRMNNPDRSAIVVIMQRVHDADVSGTILAGEMGYEHLQIPMEYDSRRHCATSIGWEDPRTVDGELAFPSRYSAPVVKQLKNDMSDYAIAGQFQQAPTPRGGGLFKTDHWRLWPPEGEETNADGKPLKPLRYPPMDYIVASLDTAYTTKEENDYSALTIWGVFHQASGQSIEQRTADSFGTPIIRGGDQVMPAIMLMEAWQERLEFHDLVEKVTKTCKKRGVSTLLIEAKANGISVAQEIARLCRAEEWGTVQVVPKGDKVARAHSVQHMLRNGMVYAPDRKWADLLIEAAAIFPRGAHDDIVDSMVQALQHLRSIGLAQFTAEIIDEQMQQAVFVDGSRELPYDV